MSIWVEKYRPSTLDEVILPNSIRKQIESIFNKEEVSFTNLLLSGPAGTGKTSCAKLIPKILDLPYLYINASEESGIDVVRNKIRDFATSQSIDGKLKVIILDESDALTPATMSALRNTIEATSKTTRYIFTCNYPEKIIAPLHSRLKQIEFFKVDEKTILRRLLSILKKEGIAVDKEQGQNIVTLIKKYHPDIRKILNHLQYFCESGELDIIFDDIVDIDIFDEILENIRTKKISKIREILRGNKLDYNGIIKKIYNEVLNINSEFFKDIPEGRKAEIIILCADALFKSNFITDAEINFAAFCVELAKLEI